MALGPVLMLVMVPLAGEESSDLVRHFLIESSTKGVHLKGASEELYFGKDGAVAHSSPDSPGSCFQSPWRHQPGPGECVAHLPAQEPPRPRSCLHFPDSETLVVAPKQEHVLPGTLLQGGGVWVGLSRQQPLPTHNSDCREPLCLRLPALHHPAGTALQAQHPHPR